MLIIPAPVRLVSILYIFGHNLLLIFYSSGQDLLNSFFFCSFLSWLEIPREKLTEKQLDADLNMAGYRFDMVGRRF